MKHTLPLIFLCAVVALFFGITPSAEAQTSYLSPKQQKRELRNSLKEAKRVETDYSESHLDVSAYNHRKGESGRKLKKSRKKDLMPINEDGTAVIKPKVFSRKGAATRARKS
ncbi:hypothetical protein [Rufibacter aurantiacus]|uniref:hypothetical protein n=1 Tax=Rufibacter aurantiacus TaxID=2817374 RepID=UPI001B30DE8B|nr:hypothetical protein [Rufibacter aurantiacus]